MYNVHKVYIYDMYILLTVANGQHAYHLPSNGGVAWRLTDQFVPAEIVYTTHQ